MLRVLSFDGGGRNGALTAHLMDLLADTAFIRKAEVLAGTSTGSIIACCLAIGMAPGAIADLYDKRCKEIFRKDFFAGYGAKYTSNGLRDILTEHFGTLTLGELPQRVVIASYRLGTDDVNTYDEPVLFHTLPLPDATPGLSLVDACLASSAAPTYFPCHSIEGRLYVDGGVWCNDPTLDAVTLASDAYDVPHEQIASLSFGTGWSGFRSQVKERRLCGWNLQWVPMMTNCLVDATCLYTPRRMQHLLKDGYCRVCPELDKEVQMDDCSDSAIQFIKDQANKFDLALTRDWIERVWNQEKARMAA